MTWWRCRCSHCSLYAGSASANRTQPRYRWSMNRHVQTWIDYLENNGRTPSCYYTSVVLNNSAAFSWQPFAPMLRFTWNVHKVEQSWTFSTTLLVRFSPLTSHNPLQMSPRALVENEWGPNFFCRIRCSWKPTHCKTICQAGWLSEQLHWSTQLSSPLFNDHDPHNRQLQAGKWPLSILGDRGGENAGAINRLSFTILPVPRFKEELYLLGAIGSSDSEVFIPELKPCLGLFCSWGEFFVVVVN